MSRVLIIEDEAPMAEAIRFSLSREGMDVDVAADGETGLEMMQRASYDMLVLDLMLPGIGGLDLCRRVRREHDTPIVILTAKDSEVDKVLGLELGADDYITKPFGMMELIARIKAVMRRSRVSVPEDGQRLLDGGEVLLDLDRHEVTVRGTVVDVTPIEFRLLLLFLRNQGKVLSRELLLSAGWQGEFYAQNRALDVHIRRIREKIERDPARPAHIMTVRGVGYRFEPDRGGADGGPQSPGPSCR